MLKHDPAHASGLLNLCQTATRVVDAYLALDIAAGFGRYSTFYFSRTLGLAATVLLRMHHSALKSRTDAQKVELCYFTAIRLLRKRSTALPNLDSKLATILTDLWTSSKIFHNGQDKVNSLNVRVRSRLVSHFVIWTMNEDTDSGMRRQCARCSIVFGGGGKNFAVSLIPSGV